MRTISQILLKSTNFVVPRSLVLAAWMIIKWDEVYLCFETMSLGYLLSDIADTPLLGFHNFLHNTLHR